MALYEKYPLTVFNSLNRQKELFTPLVADRVGLYVCGPTVYNEAHLGNVRTFLTFDILYRYLTYLGYKVRYVRNITDVGHLVSDADEGEDKIEKRARLEKIEPMEIVQKYTNGFHAVTKLFNLIDPNIEPTATGHIIEQIEMVERIIANGYGYEVNGSVYFDVKKFLEKYDYGKLSGRKVDELLEQTRESLEGGSDKRYFADFAIWKAAAENTIMKWNSPWGKGVPGWHLECSVMSTKYLGETFDIHGGGMDLKFPHHECEIAQSIGADGKDPVRYWMHGNMLTVNGTKMSKSLGNSFLPLELITGEHPLLDQGYSAMTVRFFFLQAHYRSTVDFSNDALKAAEKGYKKLMNSLKAVKSLDLDFAKQKGESDGDVDRMIVELFENLSDDLNTAKALAVLFEMSALINGLSNQQVHPNTLSIDSFKKLASTFSDVIENVLGLQDDASGSTNKLNDVMNLLIELRAKARADRDWSTSDKIRDDLQSAGITLKDNKEGTSYIIEN
ncbi:MAG: cysteine--tRNA ligase [Flavobacteriales bacterium]|nr:cysteine--tRNA ligase [Flavobacteriales bacterium]